MAPTSPRPPTLLALPSYLAGHVSRIGHRTLVDAVAGHGLRLPHFAVLAALSDFGPLPQYELADRLGLNRSHLVGYLDRLEGDGHITREREATDRRRHQVALTRSGTALFAELVAVAEESEPRRLEALTIGEQRTLTELLRRIVVADDVARHSTTDR